MLPDIETTRSCPLNFILNVLRVKNVLFKIIDGGGLTASSKILPSRAENNHIISRVDSLHILPFSSGEVRLIVEPADSKRRCRDMCPLYEICGDMTSEKEVTISIRQVTNIYIWLEAGIYRQTDA